MQIEDLFDLLPASYSDANRELLMRAYRVAAEAHKDQKRASGEPYITHCLAVAAILAKLRVPPPVIAAGLLHDTVEDTDVTPEDIERDFGPEVRLLVQGVTKLTELPRVSRGDQQATEEEREQELRDIAARRGLPAPEEEIEQMARSRKAALVNETLRKTVLAMGNDPRVPLIKLADRLHNMRTLGYMPEYKRQRIAQQTLDIFAPLANRMGIWQIKWELEDLALRHVNPEIYKEIADKFDERRSTRENQMRNIIIKLQSLLKDASIEADISGRPKHIYSIYRKMYRKSVPFEQVHDIRGVRIIVPSVKDCYAVLGEIHANWRPIPKEFDDYIAAPKDNFYRSLHTAVIYDDGKQLEVQIRTPEMHQHAEFGIAAHWIYKEGETQAEGFRKDVRWLQQFFEDNDEDEDAGDFIEGLQADVFNDRVYVFTPRGDIIDLPTGSTPIDFAYYVHTEVGHRCRGAKVNGRLVNLNYNLKTGDQVEILTAKRGGPSRDWLNPNLGLVHSRRVVGKIKRWFRQQNREQNIGQGKSILDREFRRLGLTTLDTESLVSEFGFQNVEEMYVSIAVGDLSLRKIIEHLTLEDTEEIEELLPTTKPPPTFREGGDGIAVRGLKGLLTNIAKCCNPAPGDEIIGYITRGRGATVHRKDCPNILSVREKERLVAVTWGEDRSKYPVSVRIQAFDRDGLTRDVSVVIADEGIGISKAVVTTKKTKGTAVFDLILDVDDIRQLSKVLSRLESLPNVVEARRVKPG